MKRIGAIGLFFAGTILCSCMVASAQPPMGPPDRGSDDREGPPGVMKREFAPPCRDFERAIREAYERGFRQGFGQGFKMGMHDGPKYFRDENKFREHGPRPDGPPREYGDFRGRGDGRSGKGGFGPDQQGPPVKFVGDRGPRPDGPPREHGDFRGRGGDRPGKNQPGPRPPKPEHDGPESPPKPPEQGI